MQTRFGVVAISDSADRHRGASGSRRSVDIFPFQEGTGSAQSGLDKPKGTLTRGDPRIHSDMLVAPALKNSQLTDGESHVICGTGH